MKLAVNQNIISYLTLLRPKHYVKNLFVFLPLFFGQKFLDLELVIENIWVFVCFSMIASAVYVLNDYMVSINGLSSVGENFFISSYSRTEIAGSNVIEGQGKMFCQGQETITMLP